MASGWHFIADDLEESELEDWIEEEIDAVLPLILMFTVPCDAVA